eukprot:69351-Rhodomonas_salina.2
MRWCATAGAGGEVKGGAAWRAVACDDQPHAPRVSGLRSERCRLRRAGEVQGVVCCSVAVSVSQCLSVSVSSSAECRVSNGWGVKRLRCQTVEANG